jgi:two-component system, NtrC family, sensor kinase
MLVPQRISPVTSLDDVIVPFLESFPWPVIMLDEGGRVIFATKGLGLTIRNDGQASDCGSLEQLFPEYYLALKGEIPWLTAQEAEITRELPDGVVYERIWLRRAPWGAYLVIVDETELHRLASADIQTARLASLGFMVAGVCHEVSNPLAAIHSMVQILRSDINIGHDVLQKGLTNIAANVKRILDISRRLVDFGRVGEEPRKAFAVDASIEDALLVLRQNRYSEQIEFLVQSDRRAVMFGNMGQMQEVFSNIILNAIQAMEGKGQISVTTSRGAADRIVVVIGDRGPGIPPEIIPRLFEPFFTTKAVGRGTGLGLAISYEIVHEHGGSIRVENNPNGGASFYVELPLYKKRP